jgi:hypothetical protein
MVHGTTLEPDFPLTIAMLCCRQLNRPAGALEVGLRDRQTMVGPQWILLARIAAVRHATAEQ